MIDDYTVRYNPEDQRGKKTKPKQEQSKRMWVI